MQQKQYYNEQFLFLSLCCILLFQCTGDGIDINLHKEAGSTIEAPARKVNSAELQLMEQHTDIHDVEKSGQPTDTSLKY